MNNKLSLIIWLCRREEHAGTNDAAQQTVSRPSGGIAEESKKEDLPAIFDVCGLQGGRVQRLDQGAAGVRSVLLPGQVYVPAGQSH